MGSMEPFESPALCMNDNLVVYKAGYRLRPVKLRQWLLLLN